MAGESRWCGRNRSCSNPDDTGLGRGDAKADLDLFGQGLDPVGKLFHRLGDGPSRVRVEVVEFSQEVVKVGQVDSSLSRGLRAPGDLIYLGLDLQKGSPVTSSLMVGAALGHTSLGGWHRRVPVSSGAGLSSDHRMFPFSGCDVTGSDDAVPVTSRP